MVENNQMRLNELKVKVKGEGKIIVSKLQKLTVWKITQSDNLPWGEEDGPGEGQGRGGEMQPRKKVLLLMNYNAPTSMIKFQFTVIPCPAQVDFLTVFVGDEHQGDLVREEENKWAHGD